MKRLLGILGFLMAISGLSAKAFSVNGIYYLPTAANSVEVTNGVEYTDDIVIPATVTSGNTTYAVTSIGDNAFLGCSVLNSVSIPSSVTSIGYSAFAYCLSLSSINIPASVTTLGGSAFYSCSSLLSVTIPASVLSIGELAFYKFAGSIYVDVNNPNYSSQDGVLYNKQKTTLMQCPVSKSGNFEIPASVANLGDYAFWACTGLTRVAIPSSVVSVGSYSFYNCSGLQSIFAYPTAPVSLSSNTVFNNVDKVNCALYVPAGSKGLYQAATGWKDFVNIREMITTANESPKNQIPIIIYNTQAATLQISGFANQVCIFIYNEHGDLQINRTASREESVDLSFLSKGVYFVKAIGDGQMLTKKILIRM